MSEQQPKFHPYFHKFMIYFALWMFAAFAVLFGIKLIYNGIENGYRDMELTLLIVVNALLIVLGLFTVKVRFECVNTSDRPVTILEVQARCGCIKATWKRKAVKPGKRAFIDVEYDPSRFIGEHKAQMTILSTNGELRKYNTITVRSYVERDETVEQMRHPYILFPGLRSDREVIGMRLCRKGETPIRHFELLNDSSAPVTLYFSTDTPDLAVSVQENQGASPRMPMDDLPEKPCTLTLAPGTKTTVTVTLNTRPLPSGAFSFRLYIRRSPSGSPVSIPVKGAIE